MDILAAMFAYLVCIAGLVTGLVMSFVVFFSAPGDILGAADRRHSDGGKTEQPEPANTALRHPLRQPRRSPRSADPTGRSLPRRTAADSPVAIDARQKPLFSQAHFRRLAEKERAKQLAYRERSSFETRFLHFDD